MADLTRHPLPGLVLRRNHRASLSVGVREGWTGFLPEYNQEHDYLTFFFQEKKKEEGRWTYFW